MGNLHLRASIASKYDADIWHTLMLYLIELIVNSEVFKLSGEWILTIYKCCAVYPLVDSRISHLFNAVEGPAARKASVKRYLEKKKDRYLE